MTNILLPIFLVSTIVAQNGMAHDAVENVLDNLHIYAANAKSKPYFNLFTKEAIFMGTDPTERWSIDEFKAYAEPYFSKGQGWTYIMKNRHIYFSDDGNTAWFDEVLLNAKYGECRGTGVLINLGGGVWRISQYNLTVPIPNDLMGEVAEMIRAQKDNQ